jgi:hypothetical protein
MSKHLDPRLPWGKSASQACHVSEQKSPTIAKSNQSRLFPAHGALMTNYNRRTRAPPTTVSRSARWPRMRGLYARQARPAHIDGDALRKLFRNSLQHQTKIEQTLTWYGADLFAILLRWYASSVRTAKLEPLTRQPARVRSPRGASGGTRASSVVGLVTRSLNRPVDRGVKIP